MQCGVPVDLKKITLPAFLYASREDHIVPWEAAYESTKVLGGPTTFVLGASGHIAGVINPPTKKKRNYWTGDVAESAEAWLAQGRERARQLVADVERMARPVRRRQGRRAEGPGQCRSTRRSSPRPAAT